MFFKKGAMFLMKENELTPEQKAQYDKIMIEMRAELDVLPESDADHLSCAVGNRPYQEVSKKYLPRLKAILESK